MVTIDRSRVLAVTLATLVAAASASWLPFDGDLVVYQSPDKASSPAGPITASFSLGETAQLPSKTRIPPAGSQPCFGIRFATYARTNRGRLAVGWAQDGSAHSWTVQAGDLEDNTYRYFCPGSNFDPHRPFRLHVNGIDSPPDKAATLWLVDRAPMGNAQPGNDTWHGKGMALAIAARKRVNAGDILRLGHGAFLLCWLCSLFIGMTALAFAFHGPSNQARAYNTGIRSFPR
jgi:hypothetical protein